MSEREYEICVETMSNGLLRYICKNIGSLDSAKDIMQDSFVTLWEHKTKVDSQKVKSFLYTVAHNKMLNEIRNNSRRFLEHSDDKEFDNNFESRQMIDYLCENLSSLQRECLMLKDWQGFKINEIATILGISEENVKISIFRARIKIKKLLGKEK